MGVRLVLASASPRRAELLSKLGLRFRILKPGADETAERGWRPVRVVRELAVRKARSVGAGLPRPAFVLAADTMVVLDGRPIGKPADARDARRTLSRLAGRTHFVFTGIAVRDPAGRTRTRVVRTRVRFAHLSPAQIRAYVATGEPLDKAGAYGIQGLPSGWVRSVEGDYTNVVGLPLQATLRLLRAAGFPLPAHRRV